MNLSFAKLYFMHTDEEHQVLCTREDHPEGPAMVLKTVFASDPEVKTQTFQSAEERYKTFNHFTHLEAIQFFQRADRVRKDFYTDRREEYA